MENLEKQKKERKVGDLVKESIEDFREDLEKDRKKSRSFIRIIRTNGKFSSSKNKNRIFLYCQKRYSVQTKNKKSCFTNTT